MALPVVIFFNLSQALEVSITNTGFLMLMGMQIKQYVDQTRAEHLKLVNWNTTLQKEVDKRTQELKKVNDQKTTAFINVAHEIKTPLTLINNYLDDYIGSQTESEELTAVKKNIEKLNKYIVNFFDVEKANNGFVIIKITRLLISVFCLRKEFCFFSITPTKTI